MGDMMKLKLHWKKHFNIPLNPKEKALDERNETLDPNKYKSGDTEPKFKIFGNMPVDRTSTRTDNQHKFEHILDLSGNTFIEVPGRNIIIEFYMQAHSDNGISIRMKAMGGAMGMVALPWLSRHLQGLPIWTSPE